MTALGIVLEAAERRARELLSQAANYERLATPYERSMGTGQAAFAEETMREHCQPLLDAIEAVRDGPMYVVGMLTFVADTGDGQEPEHTVSGPFWTIEAARDAARDAATDPDEGVILRIVGPR